MLNYYVEGGRLFLANKTKAALEPPVVQGDSLILTRREEARFVPVTLNVVAYTNCEECLPVIIEQDSALWGRINHRYPFNEWELCFKEGKLVDVTPVKLQSREDLRKELLKDGVMGVLSDDDRVAKKHLEQLSKRDDKEYW